MIDGKTILAVIPARGGSKGIPKKNISLVLGKPLISWTIEEAKKSKYIDRLILSSDDHEIMNIALKYGCEVPFVRPKELSDDFASGMDAVLHAVDSIGQHYDYVLYLQPTSPLRTADDIDNCIEMCISEKAPACVSVTTVDKSPYWMFFLDQSRVLDTPVISNEGLKKRRQDINEAYVLNGALYFAKTDWLKENKVFVNKETLAYKMPNERSIDIDTVLDLKLFEMMVTIS
ncbi:cytidylyltransferase domain-containing protein [Cohnella phaseoli]|uniref:N-acylneuraminate cytidylyltransferase n=1 Tax=Cohnella phaseoli TaxID=456490 RepID=A0A3D9KBX7_9BACL|nr:acylneuraminate cytidylyltransferase family protein [Cohnella phaseoli]RED84034.1 N-acylneuraminate cytidylyltransferase [Cohnella phaseoli]